MPAQGNALGVDATARQWNPERVSMLVREHLQRSRSINNYKVTQGAALG